MGYDLGDSFFFNFEPNVFPFGSKSNEKLSPRSHPIQCESKWKYSFLSALKPDDATDIYDHHSCGIVVRKMATSHESQRGY